MYLFSYFNGTSWFDAILWRLSLKKNVLNTIGMSYVSFLIGLVCWILIGYSLAYGGTNPYIGNFEHVFLLSLKFNSMERNVPK